MTQISVVIRNVRRWAWRLALLCVAALVLAAEATRSVKGIVYDQNGNTDPRRRSIQPLISP
jgi:hypothetical protein